MFILDTNVISELRKPKADRFVAQWAELFAANQFFLSVITMFEIERGALQIARKDVDQGRMLRTWIDRQIIPRFDGRILPIDTAVTLRCATLHVPDPRPERDAFIAATALVHGMIVATRNVADFENLGVGLVNPWDKNALKTPSR